MLDWKANRENLTNSPYLPLGEFRKTGAITVEIFQLKSGVKTQFFAQKSCLEENSKSQEY